jgi:hypothetical protein
MSVPVLCPNHFSFWFKHREGLHLINSLSEEMLIPTRHIQKTIAANLISSAFC